MGYAELQAALSEELHLAAEGAITWGKQLGLSALIVTGRDGISDKAV